MATENAETDLSDPAYCECRATVRHIPGGLSLYFPKNTLDLGKGHRHSWTHWRTTTARHALTVPTRRDKRGER